MKERSPFYPRFTVQYMEQHSCPPIFNEQSFESLDLQYTRELGVFIDSNDMGVPPMTSFYVRNVMTSWKRCKRSNAYYILLGARIVVMTYSWLARRLHGVTSSLSMKLILTSLMMTFIEPSLIMMSSSLTFIWRHHRWRRSSMSLFSAWRHQILWLWYACVLYDDVILLWLWRCIFCISDTPLDGFVWIQKWIFGIGLRSLLLLSTPYLVHTLVASGGLIWRIWRAWRLPGRWPDGGRSSTVARWTRRRAAPVYAPIPELTWQFFAHLDFIPVRCCDRLVSVTTTVGQSKTSDYYLDPRHRISMKRCRRLCSGWFRLHPHPHPRKMQAYFVIWAHLLVVDYCIRSTFFPSELKRKILLGHLRWPHKNGRRCRTVRSSVNNFVFVHLLSYYWAN